MRLQVAHRTTYRFDPARRGVIQSHRLTPSSFTGHEVVSWNVALEGGDLVRGAGFRDGAGDWIETIAMRGALNQLDVVVTGEVITSDQSGVVRGLKSKVPPKAYMRPGPMTQLNGALRDLAHDAVVGQATALDQAHALARKISETIRYVPGSTDVQTTAADALAQGSGVCQDQTHAMIAVARAIGLPGRYVTGYLHSSADGSAHEASHAWAELWIDDLGWVGFDPANGCCPDEKYIRVGCGQDATSAAPIRGVSIGQGAESMDISLSVLDGQQ